MRDGTLIGKQVLYATDKGDSKGYKIERFKVASWEQTKHNGSSGVQRLGKWKLTPNGLRDVGDEGARLTLAGASGRQPADYISVSAG